MRLKDLDYNIGQYTATLSYQDNDYMSFSINTHDLDDAEIKSIIKSMIGTEADELSTGEMIEVIIQQYTRNQFYNFDTSGGWFTSYLITLPDGIEAECHDCGIDPAYRNLIFNFNTQNLQENSGIFQAHAYLDDRDYLFDVDTDKLTLNELKKILECVDNMTYGSLVNQILNKYAREVIASKRYCIETPHIKYVDDPYTDAAIDLDSEIFQIKLIKA